jgi:hypothetical protein
MLIRIHPPHLHYDILLVQQAYFEVTAVHYVWLGGTWPLEESIAAFCDTALQDDTVK